MCCVTVDKRKDVHTDGEECELRGCLISNREFSKGDSRFHIENHHLQSEEVAVVDIDYHDTVKGCSYVAEGVRKLRYSLRTFSGAKNCWYVSREIVSS